MPLISCVILNKQLICQSLLSKRKVELHQMKDHSRITALNSVAVYFLLRWSLLNKDFKNYLIMSSSKKVYEVYQNNLFLFKKFLLYVKHSYNFKYISMWNKKFVTLLCPVKVA